MDPFRNDPRFAGDVKRYHTCPTIKEQSVAHHGWNTARIVAAIYPEAGVSVIYEALFHDNGELVAGDMPYPGKKARPDIAADVEELEQDTRLSMCLPWGLPAPVKLTLEESNVVDLADRIEMMEFGLHEEALGNSYGGDIADGGVDAVIEILFKELPNGVLDRALAYLQKRWPEVFENDDEEEMAALNLATGPETVQ